MNFFRKSAIVAAAGLSLVAGTAAMALDAGPYSRANVAQATPFGAITVNVGDLSPSAAMNLVGSLSPGQLAELNQRCAVVIGGPFYYGRANAAFCERVLNEQDLLPVNEDLPSDDAAPIELNSDGSSSSSSSSSSSA